MVMQQHGDFELPTDTSFDRLLPQEQRRLVLEAFAAEIPVVSTDVGACRELVEGTSSDHAERAGFVVPVGDAEKLAGALLELAADPARAAAFGRAGRRRVEQGYTQDGVISRFRSLYVADR